MFVTTNAFFYLLYDVQPSSYLQNKVYRPLYMPDQVDWFLDHLLKKGLAISSLVHNVNIQASVIQTVVY